MVAYKLYLLNSDDRIERAQNLTAPNEVTALQAARQFSRTGFVEVWQGTQLVARIHNQAAR